MVDRTQLNTAVALLAKATGENKRPSSPATRQRGEADGSTLVRLDRTRDLALVGAALRAARACGAVGQGQVVTRAK